MEHTERLIETIEDYTRMKDLLFQISYMLNSGRELPTYIPHFNDLCIADSFSTILEELKGGNFGGKKS